MSDEKRAIPLATASSVLVDTVATERSAVPLPRPEDLHFVQALRGARLVADLSDDELVGIVGTLGVDGVARRIDLLERYYGAHGDRARSTRRCRADRFLLHRDDDAASATTLADALGARFPELGDVTLERIGDESESEIVLRAGELISAVIDDTEEGLDTDEVDLRELENRRASISVRELVRSLNVLLERARIGTRLVALATDESREAYVGVSVEGALLLSNAQLLDDNDPDRVLEFAAW